MILWDLQELGQLRTITDRGTEFSGYESSSLIAEDGVLDSNDLWRFNIQNVPQ